MCAITLIITSNVKKTAHLPLGILMGKMPLVGSCPYISVFILNELWGFSWFTILITSSVHHYLTLDMHLKLME